MDSLKQKIKAFLDVGDGYGNGNGDGYGYGNGYGFVEFEGNKLYYVDDIPTCIIAVHANYATGFTIKDNSIKVPCYIARVDNFFAHGKDLHEAVESATQKAMKARPLFERIAEVVKTYDPTDVVSNKVLYNLHHILTGSCDFGRRQFCEQHNIDLDGSMTIADFIELTKSSYGGNAILQLAKEYGIELNQSNV